MEQAYFKRDLLLLALLCLTLLCFQLGAIYYLNPDESRYVDAAREMLLAHQWVTPTLNGTAFLDKPALFYWIEMVIMKIFGLHEWSIRLLPVGFASFACVMNYIAGRYLYDRKTAWFAALILLTSTLFFIAAHYTNMDLMVASLISGSLWLSLIWLETGRSGFIIGAYGLAGLAFLTKGLIALVFPILILLSWLAIYRRFDLLLKMRIFVGVILVLAINLPWFLWVQARNPEFNYYFFYVQQFLRFSGNHTFNMRNPAYYYVMIIIAGLLPWSLFLIQALFQKGRKEVFMLLWIGLITLFFSIPASKTPGYILPVFPPAAFLIGRYLAKNWQNLRQLFELKVVALVYTLVFLSGTVFVISNPHLVKDIPRAVLDPSLILINVSSIFLVSIAFAWPRKSVSLAFFTTLLLFQSLFLLSLIKPIETDRNQKSIAPLAGIINQNSGTHKVIIEYFRYDYDLLLYTGQDVKVVWNWNDPNIINDDSWRRELMEDVFYKHVPRQPNLILPTELPALWHDPHSQVFLVASPNNLPELKHLLGPLIIRFQNQNFILVSPADA